MLLILSLYTPENLGLEPKALEPESSVLPLN